LYATIGKVGSVKILAAIGASIDAISGAGKDEVGIVRMRKDTKLRDFGRSIWTIPTSTVIRLNSLAERLSWSRSWSSDRRQSYCNCRRDLLRS
jgi:hypothetical protein